MKCKHSLHKLQTICTHTHTVSHTHAHIHSTHTNTETQTQICLNNNVHDCVYVYIHTYCILQQSLGSRGFRVSQSISSNIIVIETITSTEVKITHIHVIYKRSFEVSTVYYTRYAIAHLQIKIIIHIRIFI